MVVDRKFSLLMSVYAGERASFLVEALTSLCEVLEKPAEIVLVEDGPLGSDLAIAIDSFMQRLPLRRIKLDVNQGLGIALNFGLAECSHELVARFDSDDICLPHRFSAQVAFMLHHPEVVAVSSWVEEFDAETGVVRALRSPPSEHEELVRFAKMRNPLNHPAVMFRRSAVERVGGYQGETGFEDYSLWLRLLIAGHRLSNSPCVLVRMRAGAAQIKRRGGWRYASYELKFARKMYRIGCFSTFEFLRFIVIRLPFRLLASPMLHRAYLLLGRIPAAR